MQLRKTHVETGISARDLARFIDELTDKNSTLNIPEVSPEIEAFKPDFKVDNVVWAENAYTVIWSVKTLEAMVSDYFRVRRVWQENRRKASTIPRGL